MKIVVCVKQVPNLEKMILNKRSNQVIRDSEISMMNIYDRFALEEALKVKDKVESNVMSISMGNKGALKVIKDSISMGSDSGVLLCDNRFAGSDTLATSYILSKGINKSGSFDLIICGKQTTDGDTGQIGVQLATRLNIPYIVGVTKILNIQKTYIECEQINDGYIYTKKLELPALITIEKNINSPRIPSLKSILSSHKHNINIWNLEDICGDENKCGIKGSATKVVATTKFDIIRHGEIVEGNSLEEKIRLVIEKLNFVNLI